MTGAGAQDPGHERPLHERRCPSCSGEIPELDAQARGRLRAQLDDAWTIVDGHHLFRSFEHPDFRTALDHAVAIGELADRENHHPDLLVAWGRLEVTLSTHAVGGLTEADFVLAAKIDRLP
jgi:4a-hydroxytetrahydrobiopterin dehydratase